MMRPMLAVDAKRVDTLPYPLGATCKIDGIRALKIDGEMKSRSLKPIRNTRINQILSEILPEGADGEIVVGKIFQETSSSVMSFIDSDNFQDSFTFFWFDWIKDGETQVPYTDRTEAIKKFHAGMRVNHQVTVTPLIPVIVNNSIELLDFEHKALQNNHEGVIVRTLDSEYKYGRSTLRQAWMLKLKRFQDDEVVITGFHELLQNKNEAFLDERNYIKRSSHKSKKTMTGILGSFIVENKYGITFKVGSGFNSKQRADYWANRDQLLGKIIKIKYFSVGCKVAPRHPIFIGFRDNDDM